MSRRVDETYFWVNGAWVYVPKPPTSTVKRSISCFCNVKHIGREKIGSKTKGYYKGVNKMLNGFGCPILIGTMRRNTQTTSWNKIAGS